MALLSVFSTQMHAADITGTMVGTVSDPSGAKIVGAQVSIQHVDRGRTERTLATDSDGNFSASLLPIGKYTITVESKGFKKATLTGIVLNVNDKLTFPVSLQVGSITEEVTVEESPVAVQLQAAEQSTTITGTQIRELTLNNRNYEQLVTLMPGVSSSASDQIYVGVSNPAGGGQSNQVNFSINGSRPTQNSWTVDGADNVDRGANLTLLNYPSVDALQEFKVLRSNYSAEFGRAAGGQINVVTKSGTSTFHGDAYEFVRNDAFAANSTLNTSNNISKTPPLRYNNFGWTLGGPIFIPKLYNKERNKTFFFVSEEFRRVITYTSAIATVPTAGMLSGNFANPVCLVYTGSVCTSAGTRVANISPLAQAYVKDIFGKIPNGAPGTFSSVTPLRNVYNFEQELYKLDHVFSPKLQVSVRFLRDQIPTVEPGGLFTGSALPGVSVTNTNSPGRSWVGRAMSSITPTLVNEAGFAYSYGAVLSVPTGLGNSQTSPDVKAALPFPVTLGRVPSLTFSGGSGIAGFGPYVDVNKNYNAYDNVSQVFGRHNLKYGFSYNYYQKTENAGGNNVGTFAFAPPAGVVQRGSSTYEQAWADFLIGRVSTFSQASKDVTPDIRAQQWEVYLQDDFRLRPNFTINLGIRYSMFRNPIDNNNQLSTFDPASYFRTLAPTITAAGNLAAPNTALTGTIIANQNSPYGDKVSTQPKLDFAPRVGFAWDPFKTGKTSIRGGYGIFYDATAYGFYELNIFNNLPFVNSLTVLNTSLDNPLAGTPSVSLTPPSVRGTSPNYVLPYTQQWNFSIQRQLTNSLLLDVSYVGSKSTHLLGIVDINEVYPGAAFSSGIIPAGTVVTSATTPRLNAIRPYPGYTAINTVVPWFNANYNSLQVFARKQFKGDSQASISYTYSKSLTNNQTDNSTAPQNSYNFQAEYGRAPQDRRHVFSANYVYELPFLRTQKGVVGKVLGGWEVSGIVQVNTGLPLTPTNSGVDPAGLGFLGASSAGARPDLICGDPNSGANAPHTITRWFNTSCFANVPSGINRPGNAGRGVINGPGFQRWDFSAFKNLRFFERVNFQIRGDAFNVFNHPNPLAVTTSFTSTLFGQVTSYRDPRIVQVSAKFSF